MAVLQCEQRSGVLWLTLDRPEVGNALDFALVGELHTVFSSPEAARAGCLVLRGSGDNFCMGGDIRVFGAGDDPSDRLGELAGALHACLRLLWDLPAPLVVGVRGWAAGAGFSLACLADILICASSARFKPAYPGLALTPDGGLTWTLPRLVGPAAAADILLRDRELTAAQARDLGLAAEVVDDAHLDERVASVAEAVAGQAATAAATRRLLRRSLASSFSEHLDAEVASMTALAREPAAQERIDAFLRRRRGGEKR